MATFRILLAGNPNCGKSTIFNSLTNLNQKTGNFSGVTVEKKIGKFESGGNFYEICDLPGAFSLNGISEDKLALSRALLGREEGDKILYVMDASMIERSMQFLLQIADLGVDLIIVITMMDILERKNISIDLEKLSEELGLKILGINAKSKEGLENLKQTISREENFKILKRKWSLPENTETKIQNILKNIDSENLQFTRFLIENTLKKRNGEVLRPEIPDTGILPGSVQDYISTEIEKNNIHLQYREELIYKSFYIKKIISDIVRETNPTEQTGYSGIDRWLLHPFLGLGVFLLLMALTFQGLFTWSEAPMKGIEAGFDLLSSYLKEKIPEGPISLLLTDGILKGIGSVLVFVPQISLLFFFISILEESGYMARASFVMDRFMGRFGLSGKSFIPLLSSAACAVPAILGSRTIEDKNDRLTTILISPLITCSARYPVYILLISTIFEDRTVLGVFNLKGVILFCLFFLGMFTALFFALIFKKAFFSKESSYFILELPEYKLPSFKLVFFSVLQKVKSFITSTGTIILYVSVILWFLANYPSRLEHNGTDSPPSESIILNSYAAKIGKTIEPVIEPLGFDWKIGISLITSFAAREVMVSTLAIIYGLDNADENSTDLVSTMQADINPKTGKKVWTTLSGISVLIFFAYACQCMSTLAVVRKETNSYLYPAFLFGYMSILAYISSLLIFQVGTYFGWGG